MHAELDDHFLYSYRRLIVVQSLELLLQDKIRQDSTFSI